MTCVRFLFATDDSLKKRRVCQGLAVLSGEDIMQRVFTYDCVRSSGRFWRWRIPSTLFLLLCLFVFNRLSHAESGILVVHVKDVKRHPVAGVHLGVEGDGGSGVADHNGKARIQLAPQTKPKSWVSLQIVNTDWVMVSPWDYRTLVPSFENEADNFVEVVVVRPGDRDTLERERTCCASARALFANTFSVTSSRGE
jgi:hypothetical protein